MADLRFPLSGNVNQTINPWTWYFPFTGNQVGLFNITLGNAGNAEVEKKILDNVGTYGRQLGRMGDVLSILLKLHEDQLSSLPEKELDMIEEFKDQLKHIERIKKAAR